MGNDHGSRTIASNHYARSRWRNGAGWTREICAVGGDGTDGDGSGDWHWRLSIAEIDAPLIGESLTYSAFPGTRREQVLLRGNALDLTFPDGEQRRLQPPFGRLAFDGELAPEAVPDGQVEVFNLIWRPARVEAALWQRTLSAPMAIFAGPGTRWALHLLAGSAHFAADASLSPMAPGDTAILAPAARRRYVLNGHGELLVIRVSAR